MAKSSEYDPLKAEKKKDPNALWFLLKSEFDKRLEKNEDQRLVLIKFLYLEMFDKDEVKLKQMLYEKFKEAFMPLYPQVNEKLIQFTTDADPDKSLDVDSLLPSTEDLSLRVKKVFAKSIDHLQSHAIQLLEGVLNDEEKKGSSVVRLLTDAVRFEFRKAILYGLVGKQHWDDLKKAEKEMKRNKVPKRTVQGKSFDLVLEPLDSPSSDKKAKPVRTIHYSAFYHSEQKH